MACLIGNNIEPPCQLEVGGMLVDIYLANRSDIAGYEFGVDEQVSNITLKPTKRFWNYRTRRDTGIANDNFSDPNFYFVHNAGFQLFDLRQDTIKKLAELTLSEVVLIFWSFGLNDAIPPNLRENRLYIMGLENGLRLTTRDSVYANQAERNAGITITMTGWETYAIRQVIPDPADYPSTTPNSEFIGTMLTPAP